MFYAGRNNKVYRKYARYRDWLYAIDDKVMGTIGVSVFNLVDVSTLRTWYAKGTSYCEAAMWATIKGVL